MTRTMIDGWDQSEAYRGRWWNATDQLNVFTGTLRFKDRSPDLEVESPPIGQEVYTMSRAVTIHGEFDNGAHVTLWGSANSHLIYDQEASSEARSIWNRSFHYAVLGAHLAPYEEELFGYSAVRVYGFDQWSRMDRPSPEGTPDVELAIYEPAIIDDVRNADGSLTYAVRISLEHPMRVQTGEHVPAGAIFNHRGQHSRVVFECTPPAPASFHALLALDLQSLLVFSYQSAAPLEAEWLGIAYRTEPLSVSRYSSLNQGFKRNLSRKQMIISASSMPPKLLFPAWWAAIDELYPACQLITTYHQGPHGILEGSVTLAIAATERIHEVLGSTKTRFASDFLPAKLKEILEHYPDKSDAQFRQFLRETFQGDRPTLATRLDEIVELVSVPRLERVQIEPKRWKNDAKLVRNKLAHSGSHVSRRDRDASELLDRVNIQTRAILTLLVLKWLGAEESVLDEAALVLKLDVQRFA